MLPNVASTLGLDDGQLGRALACAMLGAIPAMWLAGRAGNRAGVPLLSLGVVAYGVSGLMPAIAPNGIWLALALILTGAGSGTLDVLMNACVSEMEAIDGKRRMHLAHAMFSAGVFLGSVVAGLLRQAGLTYQPILLIAVVVVMLLATGSRRRVPVATPAVIAAATGRIGFDPLLVGLGLLCGVAFILENGMESWSALYLNRNLDAQPAIAALGPGVLGLSAVIGRLGGQAVAHRLGDARLIAIAGVVAAIGVTGFVFAPSWPLALPALILSSSGVSIAAPTFFGLAGRWGSEGSRGTAVSLVTRVSYLGFLVGPFYLGAVSDAVGLRFALLSLAVCALSFTLVAPWMIRRRPAVT